MKLSIEFNTLMSIMNQINKIAKRAKHGLIKCRIQLDAAANSITIVATDQDQTLQMNAYCMTESDGVAFIDGARLYSVLSNMKTQCKNSVVCLALDSDAKKLSLTHGESAHEFENYPDQAPILYRDEFDRFDGAAAMCMNQFRRLFSLCAHCISTETTRYYLGGVYFHKGQDGKLAAVATDGHKLALIKDELTRGSGMDKIPEKGFIIPRAAVLDLLNLFGKKAANYAITFEFCESRLKFTCQDFTFITKVIDGSFPDYLRVIPKTAPHWFKVNSGVILESVKSLAALSKERSRAIKIDVKSNNMLDLSISAPDGVEGKNSIEATMGSSFKQRIKESMFRIGFNGKYLMEVFGLDKESIVKMGFNTNSDPVKINLTSDENALWVIMPMRV